MPSLLDSGQIIKQIYSDADAAIKIIPSSNTTFGIELDASDGDNVATKGLSSSTKVSITNANTGVIVPAASCDGYKSFNIYTKTTSAITGSQACTLEYSPSDTDDVWFASTVTATPSGSNGVGVAGTPSNAIVARRVRVSIAAAISTGTFDLYLVMQGV